MGLAGSKTIPKIKKMPQEGGRRLGVQGEQEMIREELWDSGIGLVNPLSRAGLYDNLFLHSRTPGPLHLH